MCCHILTATSFQIVCLCRCAKDGIKGIKEEFNERRLVLKQLHDKLQKLKVGFSAAHHPLH